MHLQLIHITYLAHVVDTSSLEVTMDSVPVVREFQDVVLENLLDLPLDWELEFEIELLSGSPPYKMVSIELKELKI